MTILKKLSKENALQRSTMAKFTLLYCRNMDRNTQFAAELLITECVLCDVKGISPDAYHLRNKHLVVENMNKITKALLACPQLYGK